MKSLIASIAILGLVGMVVGVAVKADTEASVAATVTVQSISVTVSDGGVAYGAIAAGASKNTASYHETSNPDGMIAADTQTATNNGNVTETLNIRGTDSTAWTLAGTASGVTNYSHEFSKDGFATAGTALTLSNQELATGVVVTTGTQDFDLQITTPPSASDFTEQSVNVIVQATL